MTANDAQIKIQQLISVINKADKAYYVDSNPIMTDLEYDTLYNKLAELEREFPQYKDKNSPTSRVGSDIDNTLPESNHAIPVLSLDKCYSTAELQSWIERTKAKVTKKLEVVVEPKIDGASIVLYYNDGILTKALTRGNGFVGNDITENIKTIHSIPLSIQYKGFAAVRGEVYIDKSDFAKINAGLPKEEQYANARNLASGAVRRQKSKEAAEIPLKMFCYEIFLRENQIKNHLDSLIFMKNLGFPVNDLIGFYTREPKEGSAIPSVPFKNAMTGDTNSIGSCIQALTEQRSSLPYDIDGIVIKINDLETREEMGYTQHHPRWAIAYKFDAPLAETVINSISVQVGRGGRITPVANLQPVPLAGSVIARATLHNQDYINSLEVNVGDLVSISKRGDVIPAVEGVLEKRTNPAPFKLPEECPSCHSKLIVEGAHTFCPNKQCPARMLGTLQFFVSRTQMDIVSLGDKTLEYMFRNNCIRYIPDIYTFDYSRLIGVEGFGQKKVDNIIESVMKSKEKPYQTVLASLGLKDIGNKAAEVLTHIFRSVDDLIALCADTSEAYTALTQINGIGEMLANQIIEHFTNKDVLELIDSLKKCGLQFQTKETVSNDNQFLAGTKWVITGSFEHYKPRTIAGDIIKQYGGEVIDSVSGKTTHLLCGISPGSKLDKAKSLGTTIISEEQFIQIIEQQSL